MKGDKVDRKPFYTLFKRNQKKERVFEMKKLVLKFMGSDSWDRPVYQSNGHLYVDVDPRVDRTPKICTKYNDDFDGEPDNVIENVSFEFIPNRVVWN